MIRMTNGQLVSSLRDYAQDFVREYKNSKLSQELIDAIVVDFVNYFSLNKCCINLSMYTSSLRDGRKLSYEETVLNKDFILPLLISCKEQYDKSGIITSINRHSHMNECAGKAEADNSDVVKVIEDFIEGYVNIPN